MALLPHVLALAIGTPVDTNVTTLMVFKNGHGFVSERGEAVTDHGWVDVPEAPQASFGLIGLSVPDPGYTIERAISDLDGQAVATEVSSPGTHQALATISFAVNPTSEAAWDLTVPLLDAITLNFCYTIYVR